MPLTNAWDDRLGPFFRVASLANWRRISSQEVHAEITDRRIIGLAVGDDIIVPSFQFGAEGQTLPHLREVLAVLDPGNRDSWGDALWLRNPIAEGAASPAELLRGAGRDPRQREQDLDLVLREATGAGGYWAD